MKNLNQTSFANRAVKTFSVATHLFRGIILFTRKRLRWGTSGPMKLSTRDNVITTFTFTTVTITTVTFNLLINFIYKMSVTKFWLQNFSYKILVTKFQLQISFTNFQLQNFIYKILVTKF